MNTAKHCGTCKNFESDYYGIEQDSCRANHDRFIDDCRSYINKYTKKERG